MYCFSCVPSGYQFMRVLMCFSSVFQNNSSVLIASLLASTFAYPDLRVDNRVSGWKANGRATYAACRTGDFELYFGETFTEFRGGCLLTDVEATLFKDGRSVRARPYYSSGTAYSQYEIVDEGNENFCIRRVGTECD